MTWQCPGKVLPDDHRRRRHGAMFSYEIRDFEVDAFVFQVLEHSSERPKPTGLSAVSVHLAPLPHITP